MAREAWPDDPRLPALAARMRVLADPTLDAMYPQAFPARLLVHAGGASHEVLVADSAGDPALPFDALQLMDKARRMLGNVPELASVQAILGLPTNPTAMRTLRAAFGYAPDGVRVDPSTHP